MEPSRVPQLRLALKDLSSQAGLKGVSAIYSLRGNDIFSRCVMLPAVDQSGVERIIGFEAQQNVPFPLTEVVWDYQLLSRSASETELTLIAIRKELLHDVNEAVEDANFVTNVVDVAPLALFNAFRFNYPEVTECTLIIDIGARTTNLIFIEPGLFFMRVLQQGGNAVTGAVAKEFNESFQEAESRKVRDGFVNLGGAYEDPADPEVATLSKVIRNATTKLHAEITRNIGYYRANMKGSKPTQILLAGGGSSMHFTKEFFSEKFGLSVEYFNPLRNVTVGAGMDGNPVLARPHVLGEVVGLALRSQGPAPSEINLRPLSVQRRQELSSRKPFFVAAAACLMLAPLAFFLYLNKATETSVAAVENLTPRVSNLENFSGKIKKAKEDLEKEAVLTAPLLQVTSEREYWTGLLNDLNAQLPERNIWITTLEPAYKGNLLPVGDTTRLQQTLAQPRPVPNLPGSAPATPPGPGNKQPPKKTETAEGPPAVDYLLIKGLILGEQQGGGPVVVDNFIDRLRKNSQFVEIPANASIQQINPIRPQTNDAEWAYEYTLVLPLKKKLPLQ
jgi:type IV pilus assembly protein PilM